MKAEKVDQSDITQADSSDGDRIPNSGPLAPFDMSSTSDDDEAYVEITLDMRDDFLAVHSVKPRGEEDPDVLHKRSASSRIKQVSQELAHALKGLNFISKTDGNAGWPAVEKRFEELAVDGVLNRSKFAQCIGIWGSNEFAGELFDALARRRNITSDSITNEELREFWDQISDQSFDGRLQTFFDMVDKNADGRLNEEEVKEIISLSASANKLLSTIQAQAEEYARLIMEELDPNGLGYIEIYNLEMLLIQAPNQSARIGTTNSTNLSQNLLPTLEPNPLK